MNAKLGVVVALAVFGYVALNGLFMLCSPVRWAGAIWTAKGVYQDPQRRKRLSSTPERGNVRFAGGIMFLLAGYAVIAILGAYR
jgi:hypothetical protein